MSKGEQISDNNTENTGNVGVPGRGEGGVPEWMAELVQVVGDPGYERWRSMVAATGGCANPIHLAGESMVADSATGEVLHTYDTSAEPSGYLLVACGNRRSSVCPSCSEVYRADTFQLIRAGLSGGKGVPDSVSAHPRVFATLTAPSFGPVHTRREKNGPMRACRPRARDKVCEHGRPVGCHEAHHPRDERLGQPLCEQCYDYAGAVLWQSHAGVLWHRFTLAMRQELAALVGRSRRAFNSCVRVSFAKVAEYQRRGLVHFHAVIRLDGPDGASEPPPDWADVALLVAAIPAAASGVELDTPESGLGVRRLVWGDQLDIRPIILGASLEGVSETAVAGYIAKYATKGAEASGTVDFRLSCGPCKGSGRTGTLRGVCWRCAGTGLKPGLHLDLLPVTEHARRMIRTCWELGARGEFADLRLRPWAHMLGFRGHFSTKSRHYSTTLGDLRGARGDHRAQEARARLGLPALGDDTTLVMGHWRFAGSGYTPGEAIMAESIRQRVATARAITAQRAERAEQEGDAEDGQHGAVR